MTGTEHKPTFCRICEPLCGMIATVEDGKLVALRPDKDHPVSQGFACPKGIAFADLHNDPDRVTTPLRRKADGGFEPVSWDEAMTDIADRLDAIHRRHGAGAVGWYFGNPGAFSYSHQLWLVALMVGLGLKSHLFTAGSQDVNNRFVASQLLYGSAFALPVPDVLRTDLLVVIGANPIVSHGSVLTAPRIRDRMHDINPFLHLGFHLAIQEQLDIDQPSGIRAIHAQLAAKHDDEHAATHEILECLGETLWQSQRTGTPLDGALYLNLMRQRLPAQQ